MKTKVYIIIITALTIITLIACSALESKHFNNGYCYNCGTKYEAIGRTQAGTYYECPECYFETYYQE